jgi:anti-anti-sigma factor
MILQEEKNDGAAICHLKGEIDINTAPQLRKSFDELIRRNEKKVLLDFSAVTYIDSSGLATLIEMYQRLKKIQGQMRFCGMSESVKNIFEITKLYKLFEIFDSRQSAQEDF